MPDEVKEIMEERGHDYGHYLGNHETLGKIWTGILEQHYGKKFDHDIPPHVASLMMVAVKVNRAATPSRRKVDDNYLDGHAYLTIADKCDTRVTRESEEEKGDS